VVALACLIALNGFVGGSGGGGGVVDDETNMEGGMGPIDVICRAYGLQS